MNKRICTSILIGLATVCFSEAQGQSLGADPSATSLVGSQTNWSGDEGGRYIHKPKSKSKKTKREIASDNPGPTPDPSTNQDPVPRLAPKSLEPAVAPSPSPSPTPSPAPESFTSKVRDVVLGGDDELLQSYKAFLDNQDIRKNIFEVTLETGYLYNASSSSYFFKNYNDSGPTLGVGADIWMSPFLGITAEYKTTLLNEITDSPTQNSYAATTQTWFDFGIKFRRFFGMSINSTALTFGLKYFNYQMSVPQSSQSRAKLLNQGPELDLDVTIPSTHFGFWTVGMLLQPLDGLSESSGATVRAGQSNQTVGVGAAVGGEYRFSRQTTAFVRFSSVLYKSDFSGPASTSDPVTGSTPSNVPNTNIFYFLDLGIRLGR